MRRNGESPSSQRKEMTMYSVITDESIKDDIEKFRSRILKAEAKLDEALPVRTAKDRLKAKQLRDEVEHCKNLIGIAQGALMASDWDDARGSWVTMR